MFGGALHKAQLKKKKISFTDTVKDVGVITILLSACKAPLFILSDEKLLKATFLK